MDTRSVVWVLVVCSALTACGRGPGDASQAPPSRDIAFSFGGRIYTIQADGSEATRLTGGPSVRTGADDGEPAWSPDGTQLAFVRSREGGDAFRSRLYLLDFAGGGLRPLTAADGASVSSPAWSPDGRRIAFTRFVTTDERRESQIVVAEVGGSAERVVAREALSERLSSIGKPAWSPDGARIAYTRSVLDRTFHFRTALYVIPAAGGEPQLLGRGAADAAWSPDGTRIAFSSIRDRNGEWCGSDECSYNGELYVMNADGSDRVRLTRNVGDDRSPSWSPDGRRIAFASNRNNRDDPPGWGTEVYSIGADGSCLTWLTNGTPASRDPAWRRAPAVSSDSRGCGATPRPPRTETLTPTLRARVREGTPWLGERYGNQLLSHVQVYRNGPAGRYLSFFHYDDCARFLVRECSRGLQVQVASVCSPQSRLAGFGRAGHLRLERSLAKRGLLLVELGRGSLSVIAGRAGVTMYAESGPGPARPQLIAAVHALRPFGKRAASLPAPALPGALLHSLRRTARALQQLGSVEAVARALGASPAQVRRRLALARAVGSLPRVRAVRC